MRKGVMVSVFVWLSTAILVFADSWVWNASERPAVSLDMALRRSEVLLGEDAETFYCVRAGLVGGQDKGEGAWNLRFVAVDGSQQKQVTVEMNGQGTVTSLCGPIDWNRNRGRRSGIADVQDRLEELFAAHGFHVEYTVDELSVAVRCKTRKYMIYPRAEDGKFRAELVEVDGPSDDGIVIRATETTKPDGRRRDVVDAPYWSEHHATYLLSQRGRFLTVTMQWGENFNRDVLRQILQIYGDAVWP